MVSTHQGRSAIALACKVWKVNSKDEILAPAFNCGSEIDPLRNSGAKIILYRIDHLARLDVDDIKRRRTRLTRVLYVTHYFGWPLDLADLPIWCREQGILLFEDCALSLFSAGADGPIGCTGDAAFFSFPKTLPTPDGGALSWRDPNIAIDSPAVRPPLHKTFRRTLPLLKRRALRLSEKAGAYATVASILPRRRPNSAPPSLVSMHPNMPESYYFDERTVNWCTSRVTTGVLHTANPEEIIRRRRRNYSALHKELSGLEGILPLFGLPPEGVCPLGFPLIVENRRRWYEILVSSGIGVFPWWEGYHRGFSWDEFPEASYLKDHILLLPVHQDLDEPHMAYIARQVKNIHLTRGKGVE
jgi:dTDP-4-amino-4,6-dideoxygalactose transaminase